MGRARFPKWRTTKKTFALVFMPIPHPVYTLANTTMVYIFFLCSCTVCTAYSHAYVSVYACAYVSFNDVFFIITVREFDERHWRTAGTLDWSVCHYHCRSLKTFPRHHESFVSKSLCYWQKGNTSDTHVITYRDTQHAKETVTVWTNLNRCT